MNKYKGTYLNHNEFLSKYPKVKNGDNYFNVETSNVWHYNENSGWGIVNKLNLLLNSPISTKSIVLLLPNGVKNNLTIQEDFNLNTDIFSWELTEEIEEELLKTDEMDVLHNFFIYKEDLKVYVDKIVGLLDTHSNLKSFDLEEDIPPYYALCTDILPPFLIMMLEKYLKTIPLKEKRLVTFNTVRDMDGALFSIYTNDEYLTKLFTNKN